MLVRRLLISIGFLVAATACADSLSGPQATPELHFLRWAATTRLSFTAVGASAEGRVSANGGTYNPNDLSLSTYQASFWAVRGQSRSLEINYSGAGGTSPFLLLSIADPTYVPGRGNLAVGDSVLVTATVYPNTIGVELEPTGLLFGTPATLKLWYGGAGGDLNGDGVVNAADSTIASQLLGMWYQEGTTNPWTSMSASKSLEDQSFTAPLAHFSGYAVSW